MKREDYSRKESYLADLPKALHLKKPLGYEVKSVNEKHLESRSEAWARILEVMTTGKEEIEPSVPNLLITNEEDLSKFRQVTDELIQRVEEKRSTLDALLPGLADTEISALGKGSVPGCAFPLGHLRAAHWPWESEGGEYPSDSDAIPVISEWLTTISRTALGSKGIKPYTPTRAFGAVPQPYNVAYGAYTALDPSAPGADPNANAWAIVLHSVRAREAVRIAIKRGVRVEDISEVIHAEDCFSLAKRSLQEQILIPYGTYFVVFGRTRYTRVRTGPEAASKSWPLFRLESGEEQLIALSSNNGYVDDTRTVTAPVNSNNQVITPMTKAIEKSLKVDPAFDLGPMWRTFEEGQNFIQKYGVNNVNLWSQDQGAYDQHLTKSFKRAMLKVISTSGELTPQDEYFTAIFDEAPILGRGYFTGQPGAVEVFPSSYGIKSGERLTSAGGKIIMALICLHTLSKLKGKKASEIWSRRFVSRKACPYYNPSGVWGFVNSSDDIFLYCKKGWMNWQEYDDAQAELLGLDASYEGTVIMLKQLLYVGAAAGKYAYHNLGKEGLEQGNRPNRLPMSTMIGSHWINMFLPEMPTLFTQALYAGLASRLANLQYHPMKEDFKECAMKLTSGKLPNWAYDERALFSYVNSRTFSERLIKEIEGAKKGKKNALLRSMIRAATRGEVDSLTVEDAEREKKKGASIDLEAGRWLIPALKQGFAPFQKEIATMGSELQSKFGLSIQPDASAPHQLTIEGNPGHAKDKIIYNLAFNRILEYAH